MRSSVWSVLILGLALFLYSPNLSLGLSQKNNVRFRFSSGTQLILLGDSYVGNGSISLTRDFAGGSSGAGRALYANPVRFLDSWAKSPASFSTTFSFSIITRPNSTFGDGFAFLITSDSSSIGCPNGFMGLFQCYNGPSAMTKESIIAVEFDTSLNLLLHDINGNHIALDINTIISPYSVNLGSYGIDLKCGKPMTAWIEYKNIEKAVRVWVSYSRVRPVEPILSVNIDLSKNFDEFMYVGFSASNGQGMALHLIQQWSFRTFGFPRSSSVDFPNNIIGNSYNNDNESSVDFPNNIIANSYNNDDETPDVGLQTRRRTRRGIGVALGTGAAAFLFSVAAIAASAWYLIRKKKIDSGKEELQHYVKDLVKKMPSRLSLSEIKSATRGFHFSRILGRGSAGTVYEGVLTSGKTVAVKRFDRVDHCTNIFTTEMTAMISSLRHKNLLQLQGWCCEKNELLLIYENMPNGSLDNILLSMQVSWKDRVKILFGVASALAFLHEECETQIIHRDVKSCNIMLDMDFNAKLGDFDLAVLNDQDKTPEETLPAGTVGYLAPEYLLSGIATEKTDVYSFGVVSLEVATGKRPLDNEAFVLIDWVWEMWSKGKLIESADPRLQGNFDKEEMYRMLIVGLSCVHPYYHKRPTMSEVKRMLKEGGPLPPLPPKKPAFTNFSLPKISEKIIVEAIQLTGSCGDGSTSTDIPSVRPESLPRETTSEIIYGDATITNTPWSTPCHSLNDSAS